MIRISALICVIILFSISKFGDSTCLQPYTIAIPIWMGENGTGSACGPGFYCPFIDETNNATWPSVCPPTPACVVSRLKGTLCSAQGTYEPVVCDPGWYCPDFRTRIQCPEGFYCPRGATEPIECQFWSVCNLGASQQRFYGALVFLIGPDLVVAVILFWYLLSRSKKARTHAKKFKYIELAGSNEVPKELNESQIQIIKPAVEVLVEGFQRSRRSSPPLDISFEDLRLVLPKKNKTLLAGVSGKMTAGNVTAIMGPSGAGKTIFISTLMDKIDSSWHRTGKLSVNGVETSLSYIKSSVGYVPQEDVMHRELTVWQNICYSADVRLPSSWTKKERRDYCESILDVLNLRHIKHQRIGNEEKRGISGGQRKRVNIAMELAAAPLILFLDEPTTGLDASSALEVCEVLNKIAKLTLINVAVVIHQPRVEIWNSLDNLLILAPGGKTVFLGSQRFAQMYFTRHLGIEFAAYENPADTLMDTVSKYGISFADKWKQDGHKLLIELVEEESTDETKQISKDSSEDSSSSSTSHSESQAEKKSKIKTEDESSEEELYKGFNIKKVARRRGANFFTQLYLAHVRAVKQQAVGYLSLLIELGLSLIAGILIGLAASGAYRGILRTPYVLFSASSLEFIIPQKGLFMNVAVGLAASAAGVRTFGDERVIYWREAASGHNRASYFLGVTLSVLYRIALAALHFVIMLYVVGMPMSTLGRMYLICFGIYFAVYGLGSLISMIFDRKDAPLTAVIATLVAAIMSGFITLFPYELKAISYAFWSSEAYYAGEVAPFANIYDLDLGSNTWDYNLDRFGIDMAAMIGLGVGYRVVAFILMIILHRDKQK